MFPVMLAAELSYPNELSWTEVNKATAHSSSILPIHLFPFFLNLDLQHVPQKESALNIPGVSQYVIQ